MKLIVITAIVLLAAPVAAEAQQIRVTGSGVARLPVDAGQAPDLEQLRAQAAENAMRSARSQAEGIARANGGKIGQPINVQIARRHGESMVHLTNADDTHGARETGGLPIVFDYSDGEAAATLAVSVEVTYHIY